MKRVQVGVDQLFLRLELLSDQLLDRRDVHVQKRAERAEIHDVLEQLALARIAVFTIADRVSGTPMTVMSSRNFDFGIGLVES
jgi:hypothetical protein